MRVPRGGPLLEFGFYWADISETTALARLVATLLDYHAVWLQGVCRVSTYAGREQSIDLPGFAELENCLTAPDWRVVDVGLALEHATDTVSGVAEQVRLWPPRTWTPSDASARPVTILTEGHWTETWIASTAAAARASRQQARTLGRRAKDRFCALVAATHPAFAAITVERSLPSPAELRRQPDVHAFSDFWINRTYVGAAAMARIEQAYANAYCETVGDGLYISCYPYLNPQGRNLGPDRYAASEYVSRLIARAG
jgi:hypothetical protein